MKRTLLPAAILLILLLFAATTPAADKSKIIQNYQPPGIDVANIAREDRLMDEGNVELGTTNWGSLVHWYEEYPSIWSPGCIFPKDSEIQYIWVGALWIGALIEDGDSTYARVSVGYEGWTGPPRNQYELEPGEVGGFPIEEHGMLERSCIPGAVNEYGEPIYSDDAVAHRELISVYCDTLTEQFWVGSDIVDGPHFPLGVRVTQKSMTWNASGFEDFIVFQFDVENIGPYDLKNPYLGFYMDHDVGWIGEGIWHEDDVTGFLAEYNGQTLNLPYGADNDGRPENVISGNDFTCPGVCGTYPLLGNDQILYISYNWWISNGNPDLDYGPAWEDDASGGWTAIYGTPDGDERKYFLMTNREIDFDQWYTWDLTWLENHPQELTDPFTGETTYHDWNLIPLINAGDLSNGYDTRHLLSLGPLGENVAPPGEDPETYLYPGESTTLTVAIVCGDGFHDPQNPQGDVSGNNPIDPGLYVYDDLVYNCSKAKWLFDESYLPYLPYPPYQFRITSSPDTAVFFAWNAYSATPDIAVNIQRRYDDYEYWEMVNDDPLYDTTFVDYDVALGEHFHYRAQGVYSDTITSTFTEEIEIIVGAPIAPEGLSADSSDNGVIYLSWESNTEPDLHHYVLYRRGDSELFVPVAIIDAGEASHADNTVTNGVEHAYFLTAVDDDDIESMHSDTVSYAAMAFDQHLLVIFEYATAGVFEWPGDSLDAFYQQLFLDIGEDPDFMDLHNTTSATFPTLEELSPYQIVWIIDDDHTGESFGFIDSKCAILEDYVANGGKVVYSGRRVFGGGFEFPMGWYFTNQEHYEVDLLWDNFKIESIYATNRLNPVDSVEFAGAEPVLTEFPELSVDVDRISQIYDPGGSFDYLMEVDVMIPREAGELIYTFISGYPEISELQGHAVAVRYLSPWMANTMISFPLYAMQPYESVMEFTRMVLDDIDLGIENGAGPPKYGPRDFALKQNYPNPFNAQTTIEYEVPEISHVSLKIYNVSGRMVAELTDGVHQLGQYRVTFDGNDLASGVYFAKLEAGTNHTIRKIVLLK